MNGKKENEDNMNLSEEQRRLIIRILFRLLKQAEIAELETWKNWIDSMNPDGDELLARMQGDEYERLVRRIQEIINQING